MLSVGRITLAGLVMQAHAGFTPALYNAPPVPPPMVSLVHQRVMMRAPVSEQLNPSLGVAPAAPTFVDGYAKNTQTGVKTVGKGRGTRLKYDKNAGRNPGLDSVKQEEEAELYGRFGKGGTQREVAEKPNFYSFRKGPTRSKAFYEEMFAQSESDYNAPAAALIGFLVGSGVTFALFGRRLVHSTAAPLLAN